MTKKRYSFSIDLNAYNEFVKKCPDRLRFKKIREEISKIRENPEHLKITPRNDSDELYIYPIYLESKYDEMLDTICRVYQAQSSKSLSKSLLMEHILKEISKQDIEGRVYQRKTFKVEKSVYEDIQKLLAGDPFNRSIEDYIMNDYPGIECSLENYASLKEPKDELFQASMTLDVKVLDKISKVKDDARTEGKHKLKFTKPLVFRDMTRQFLTHLQEHNPVEEFLEHQIKNHLLALKEVTGKNMDELIADLQSKGE
ncbi:hypothetical protein P4K23_28675 [Bacillus cereus]|uniref:hypothetical protein n=1 Tax=Bacillus toyonensis TaxID=155322 RepID=UPI000BFB6AC0|nr:hypothetical protein [Bacillus toyonensis]MCU5081043.1 hypothetical protein [Bacillus cereus]MEB9857287.1 hypothetical protein [Bacillus cereus]MEB9891971.1 hypothetical protein [Bacillus cereus]PHA86165.1 hypothetical protein COE77_18120 [Bacillus toyonensis]